MYFFSEWEPFVGLICIGSRNIFNILQYIAIMQSGILEKWHWTMVFFKNLVQYNRNITKTKSKAWGISETTYK